MKRILCAAGFALAAGFAMADPVLHAPNGDWVRLTGGECPAEIAAQILESDRARFSKAVGNIGGQDYVGCYADAGEVYVILWNDGDRGILPKEVMREERAM